MLINNRLNYSLLYYKKFESKKVSNFNIHKSNANFDNNDSETAKINYINLENNNKAFIEEEYIVLIKLIIIIIHEISF